MGDKRSNENGKLEVGDAAVTGLPIIELLQTPNDVMRNPFTRDWHRLPADAERMIAEQISPVDGKHRLHAVTTLMAHARLPFYDDVSLIRLIDGTWSQSGLSLYYLLHEGELFRLDGSSPALHKVNARTRLNLTADQIIDYLRFFCFFVHGERGPFLIAEAPDQSFVPDIPDLQLLDLLEDILRPPILTGRTRNGDFSCAAILFYGNGIYNAEFEIATNGEVTMVDDDPIFTDLPIEVKALLG